MKTDYFLEGYVTLDPLLVQYFGVTQAPQVRQTEPPKEEGEIESMERIKPPTRYGRKVDVYPLWEVIDERGSVLGSLAIQSGGKARFIPRSEEPRCIL